MGDVWLLYSCYYWNMILFLFSSNGGGVLISVVAEVGSVMYVHTMHLTQPYTFLKEGNRTGCFKNRAVFDN